MFEGMTEQEARNRILEEVSAYCDLYHNRRKPFRPGDRIAYASRVYDHDEMVNLVDSALEFWLLRGAIQTSSNSSLEIIWAYRMFRWLIPDRVRICWRSWRLRRLS